MLLNEKTFKEYLPIMKWSAWKYSSYTQYRNEAYAELLLQASYLFCVACNRYEGPDDMFPAYLFTILKSLHDYVKRGFLSVELPEWKLLNPEDSGAPNPLEYVESDKYARKLIQSEEFSTEVKDMLSSLSPTALSIAEAMADGKVRRNGKNLLASRVSEQTGIDREATEKALAEILSSASRIELPTASPNAPSHAKVCHRRK